MHGYSTREAARKLGLALSSLTKYITLKQVPVPPLTHVGGVRVRLWNDDDIARVLEVLPKIQNGRRRDKKKAQLKKKKKK